MTELDPTDHRILSVLQRDSTLPMEELGAEVGLSRNAAWRRVRAMEEAGIIRGRVALVDPAPLGLALQVFILIRTSSHSADWSARFTRAVRGLPEIQGAYRMTGDLDYLIRARIADMSAYDRLYQRLTAQIELSDVSASFVMEEIKDTTALPV